MRQKIDAELTAVAEESSSGGIKWCKRDVQRLVSLYPVHRRVDKVLKNLGEDFFHDDLEHMSDAEEAEADDGDDADGAGENEPAVAADDAEESSSDEDGAGENEPAAAGRRSQSDRLRERSAVHRGGDTEAAEETARPRARITRSR